MDPVWQSGSPRPFPAASGAERIYILTHKYGINIAAVSNIHSLFPQLLLVCLTLLNLGDILVTRVDGLCLHGTLNWSWSGCGLTYQTNSHEFIIIVGDNFLREM